MECWVHWDLRYHVVCEACACHDVRRDCRISGSFNVWSGSCSRWEQHRLGPAAESLHHCRWKDRWVAFANCNVELWSSVPNAILVYCPSDLGIGPNCLFLPLECPGCFVPLWPQTDRFKCGNFAPLRIFSFTVKSIFVVTAQISLIVFYRAFLG